MKELLVPVGNMECLFSAIKAGADAVYLAGKKYGARASATNFSDDEIIEATKLCHLYGVKIYITVNTLIYESELDAVINYVKFLYEVGVDALIVQDLGLISYLCRNFKDLEIHASTQVHNTNESTLKFLSDIGVKRVVLAREVSLEDANNFKTDLELEAFIHGALCVSYSGQCLFSSRILNRSGNRGECAQMCRLPYLLYCDDDLVSTNGKYLLSPKELNTSSLFKSIMESNIYSLKIEGRMKSPEYVGCVTKLYRTLIDEYVSTGNCHVDRELLNDLSIIFNREFTKGYLFKEDLAQIMNIKTSNHQGVFLGEIIDLDNKYIKVKLSMDLKQGDGIRFLRTNEGMICNYIYDLKKNLISGAKAGDKILIDKRNLLKVGDKINKTFSVAIREKYTSLPYPKIPIQMRFFARCGEELCLSISDYDERVSIKFGRCQESRNVCTDKKRILDQLLKLGNTPFSCDDIEIDVQNNVFINIKDLNELRRQATDALKRLREKGNIKRDFVLNQESTYNSSYREKTVISFLVRNEEQLLYLLDKSLRLYIVNRTLYEKYKSYDNVFYRTNRVQDNKDGLLLATELGAVKNATIGDYFLNVTNHETINILSKYLDIITLSSELGYEEIEHIMHYYKGKANVEVVVYGRLELMLMKYCPLKYLVNNDIVCKSCTCDKQYYLASNVNNDLKKYPIITDISSHTAHILNHEYLNIIGEIRKYKELGIRNFGVELFDEDHQCIEKILKMIQEELC